MLLSKSHNNSRIWNEFHRVSFVTELETAVRMQSESQLALQLCTRKSSIEAIRVIRY